MNEQEIKQLRFLESTYNWAQTVCDPDQFRHRQNVLLHALCEHVLIPLRELDKGEKE